MVNNFVSIKLRKDVLQDLENAKREYLHDNKKVLDGVTITQSMVIKAALKYYTEHIRITS